MPRNPNAPRDLHRDTVENDPVFHRFMDAMDIVYHRIDPPTWRDRLSWPEKRMAAKGFNFSRLYSRRALTVEDMDRLKFVTPEEAKRLLEGLKTSFKDVSPPQPVQGPDQRATDVSHFVPGETDPDVKGAFDGTPKKEDDDE